MSTLALQQIGEQRTQRGRIRRLLQHAAERGFRERVMLLGEVGEAERAAHLRIVGRVFGGLRQCRQRAVGVAAAQCDHAFDRLLPRMIGRDARGQAADAIGFVHVAAAERELRLQDVGAELVGIEFDAARERGLRLCDVTRAEQKAGAMELQVRVVRRQPDARSTLRARIGVAFARSAIASSGRPGRRWGAATTFAARGGQPSSFGRRDAGRRGFVRAWKATEKRRGIASGTAIVAGRYAATSLASRSATQRSA